MNFDDIKKKMRASTASDWIFNDELGAYTFKDDVNLRMQRSEIDRDRDRFQGEAWAERHPDPNAFRVTYTVYYGQSYLEDHLLVSVDGHRATLPLPKSGTHQVRPDDYHFASLVDQHGSLDEYMGRATLVVAE